MKAQNTNLRNIYGKGIKYDVNGQVVMDSNDALLVPKGSTADLTTLPVNGHIRYNTDPADPLNPTGPQIGFEFFNDGSWRRVSFREPKDIVYQTYTGDDTETVFGPLDNQDVDNPIPASGKNLIVLIENVFQLSETNYDLAESASGVLTRVSDSQVLTGPNGPYADGYYIVFGTAVPDQKPVTIIHNFDK